MDPRKKRKEVLQYSVAPIYKVLITLVLKMVFGQMSTSKVSAILKTIPLLRVLRDRSCVIIISLVLYPNRSPLEVDLDYHDS